MTERCLWLSSATKAFESEGTANNGLQVLRAFMPLKVYAVRSETSIRVVYRRGASEAKVVQIWYQVYPVANYSFTSTSIICIGVDPKAEAMGSMSPYCAMGNNPVVHTDPKGDILPAALLGAAIGVVSNGIGNLVSGNNFFAGAGKAALFGAIGGAISFGIGSAANSLFGSGASVGKAVFQMGAHSLSGGAMSAAQGGSFTSGLLSGGLSSSMSSIASSVGISGWGMVGIGGLAGGVGSSLAGGDFWKGVGQGLITSGLNHAAHVGVFGEGLAVSVMTGKIRHIIGPDALGLDVGVDAAAGGGGHAHKIGVRILRGPQANTNHILDESGVHAGLALGGSASLDRIYYSGSTSDFSISSLTGYGWVASGSLGIVGASVGYASSNKGNFVLTLGFGLGLGPLPYGGTVGYYNVNESSLTGFKWFQNPSRP